jgi:hypothetical protein
MHSYYRSPVGGCAPVFVALDHYLRGGLGIKAHTG